MICDGEPLSLPDDIEGVLFLNIHSYMGGVDLWASGVNSTGSARIAKQSLCDGKLEVSASSTLLVLVASAIMSHRWYSTPVWLRQTDRYSTMFVTSVRHTLYDVHTLYHDLSTLRKMQTPEKPTLGVP